MGPIELIAHFKAPDADGGEKAEEVPMGHVKK